MTSRWITPLAGLCAATLLAGCGSSVGPDTAGSSAAVNISQGTKFSSCMRSHGVAAFPDPDASGQLTLDSVANGSGIQVNSPTFQQALSACQSLEPAGFEGTQRTAAQQAIAIKFAQCIREHGVTDFPDPTPTSPLVDTNLIPSSNTAAGMTILHSAMATCGAEYGGQLGLRK